MMKNIAKYMIAALALLTITACNKEGGKFHITGHITEAADTTLYLEHLSLDKGAVAIDSCKLDEEGAFDLKGDTLGNPELYRLRIGLQVINLTIDSTETVGIEAALPTMAEKYKVQGSDNCEIIRQLNQNLANLQRKIRQTAEDRDLTIEERSKKIDELVQDYKTDVKINYIQGRYGEASSYYAIFQVLNGSLIFDPVTDPSDVTWVTAVANAWNEKYPGSLRTENLCNIAIQGQRNTRRHTVELPLDDDKVRETGIIDMGFPDIQGRERRLSELKGQVVLLDFTAYSMQGAQQRTIALRELYNKYHAQGLEIYQVSLDSDEHYWKTMCEKLPWVCVWNSEGIANDMVSIYNIQQIPTWFLIDKGNNLVGRQETLGELNSEIQKLL